MAILYGFAARCLFDDYEHFIRPFYRYGGHIELRNIIGCPGGMSAFRLYFRALFGTFFLKVFLE